MAMPFRFLPVASQISDEQFEEIEKESFVALSATDRQKIIWEINQYERRCGFDDAMRGSKSDKQLLRTSAGLASTLSARLKKLAQNNPTMANALVHPARLPEFVGSLDWIAEQFETRLFNTGKNSPAHYHHLARLLEPLHSIFERSFLHAAPIKKRDSNRRVSNFSRFAHMVVRGTRYKLNSEEALQATWVTIRSEISRAGTGTKRFVRPQSRRSRKQK
jgi:hypothetical protein